MTPAQPFNHLEDDDLEAEADAVIGPGHPDWPVTEQDKAYVRAAIAEGIAQLDRGEFVTAKELKHDLDELMREMRARA